MRKRIFRKFSLGLLVALPLAGGCLQQSNPPPPDYQSSAFAPLAADKPGAALTLPVPSPQTEVTAVDPAAAPAKIVAPALDAPPSIHFAPAAGEIIRMANSGLGDSVMLAYVTNTAAAFNLNADEIIYLNDIGVPATVVSAMIQHDSTFRQSAPQPIAAPGPANAPTPQNLAVSGVAPQFAVPNPAEMPTAPAAEPAPEIAAPAEDAYPYFNDALSPYGNWVQVEGYGTCWQPTVVRGNPDWRPYVDNGYWVYTDCGRYWVSDYSWGWAPFHYGRWFQHNRFGWCWAPDRIWGPSWVSWRYTDTYCGWAPLPPGAWYSPGSGLTYYGNSISIGFTFGLAPSCYSFVSFNHFCDRNVHHYCIPHTEAEHRIYPTSVAVNRIVAGKNVVINRGIEPAQVTRVTKSEVRRLSIVDSKTPPARGGRNELVDPNRNALVVYRPTAPASPTPKVTGNSRNEVSRHGGPGSVGSSAAPSPNATQPAASSVGEAHVGRPPGSASGASAERPNRPAIPPRPATPLMAPKAAASGAQPSAVPAASTASPTPPSSPAGLAPTAISPRDRAVPDRAPTPALPARPAPAPAQVPASQRPSPAVVRNPAPEPAPKPVSPGSSFSRPTTTPTPTAPPAAPMPNRSLPGSSAVNTSPAAPTRPPASALVPAVSPAPRAEATSRPFSSPTPPPSAPPRFEPPARSQPTVSAPPAIAPMPRPAAPVMAPPPPAPAYSPPAPAMAAPRPSPPPSAPAITPPAPASPPPSPPPAAPSTPTHSDPDAGKNAPAGRR